MKAGIRVPACGTLMLLLLWGCRFDRSGLPAADFRIRLVDGPGIGVDRSPKDGPEPEGPAPDGPTVDNALHDRAVPDQPVPDLPVPDHPPPPSCNQIYGSAPDYTSCQETATTCVFFIDSYPSTNSCTAVCQARGGSCISVQDEAGEWPNLVKCTPDPGKLYDCSTSDYNQICTCTRF